MTNTPSALAVRTIASRAALIGLVVATTVFGATSACTAEEARQGSPIVSYEITNFGSTADDLAVTFGSIFVRGDVPSGSSLEAVGTNGKAIPLQVDAKATYGDHSLRHAVVTLVVPHLAPGAHTTVEFEAGKSANVEAPAIAPSALPSDFDVVVTLATKLGSLSVSARDLLASAKMQPWLSGPLVSEWWLSGPFKDARGIVDPHLHVQFGIRCYGKGRPLRVEINVENDWTWVSSPQTEFYDASIRAGTRTVFAKSGMTQPSHTRWRMGFWWHDSAAMYVRQDLAYLKKARVVPNYDPNLRVSETALAKTYNSFQSSDHGPMGAGIIAKYMPMTGGRPDIGPLPQWQALYLLSMDPRLYQVTLQSADLGGSFAAHYRNERTGRPVTPEDDPNISWNETLVGRPGQIPSVDTGGYKDPLVPDEAHQPALDFIPYVITGDRFYLEELQFWSQWNVMGSAPQYHGFGKGLVSWGQMRQRGWSLRALAQAEFITPDGDPLKPVLERQLKANIDWYNAQFVNNPSANKLGLLMVAQDLNGYDGGRETAPWQDDFFTWSVGYVQSLGDVDALPLLRWKAKFPIGRMIGQGFCWILGSSYSMRVRDSAPGEFYTDFEQIYRATLPTKLVDHSNNTNLKCGSSEMAAALGLRGAGEMIQNSRGTDGYPAYMQPALAAAVDSGINGAAAAWQLFLSRPVKPDYSVEPGWDIVPWPRK